ALVARGALDEADELLAEGAAGLNPPPSFPLALLLTARANLHLAQGRPRAALNDARAAGDLVAARISNPACCGWRSAAALALAATQRAGASGMADRAHEELVAVGARPRRDRRFLTGREALTAGEDRVAALAAEGLTNREIAQRLFVTGKAVQWHLRNVYRKLDI